MSAGAGVLQRVGGVAGLVQASVPSMVFVAADAVAGLHAAVAVAVGSAAVIAALRLLRRESLQPALSGLLGVAVGALIAYQTGDAKDYFLVGIWTSLFLAVACMVSVLARRPLVGVAWNLLNGRGGAWRTDRTSVRAYDVATGALALVSAARFVVQNWLYDADATGWLAVARVAMGYPLTALALLVMVWAIRRSARSLGRRDAASADLPGTRPYCSSRDV